MEREARKLSGLFKALSDETRLAMLALLMKRGELCVCDFVEAMGITQSKASRHLRYLLNAGLLHDRRTAVWVYYRLAGDAAGEPGAVLQAVTPILLEQSFGDVEARLDAWMKTKERTGGTCPSRSGPPASRRSRRKREA